MQQAFSSQYIDIRSYQKHIVSGFSELGQNFKEILIPKNEGGPQSVTGKKKVQR